MDSLTEKLRKARESVVEVDGKRYTIRRPTEAEQATVSGQGATALDLVRRFVVDWELHEVDLIPGGSPVAVKFSAEAWVEYVDDHPELWEPLSNGIVAAIRAHREKAAALEKK